MVAREWQEALTQAFPLSLLQACNYCSHTASVRLLMGAENLEALSAGRKGSAKAVAWEQVSS